RIIGKPGQEEAMQSKWTSMSEQEKRTDLSRRSLIIGGAAVAAAGVWDLPAARAQSGKGHVNFRVAGTQDPTLIFVHGFACALDDWDGQVTALSPSLRCVALDLPGHGASAKPETVSIAT